MLRHGFAADLPEAGAQQFKTTEIYTKASIGHLQNIKSPLD